MARISLFNFFASASQKLGQAIESYDLEGMRKQLAADSGQNFDYLLMRPGDRPGEMVPACKLSHETIRTVVTPRHGDGCILEFRQVNFTHE